MYKITRANDGKEFKTESYKFVIFENGKSKEMVESPVVGSALIIPPYNAMYSWMTSEIVTVVNEFEFITKNSNYKIEKL